MDTTGEIIRRLRREKGLTQLALANLLHLSDRTVSKWECGRGLPDPGLLPELARLLGAGAEELLRGDLRENPPPGGNMKNSQALFLSPLRRGGLLRSGNEAFLLRPHSRTRCASGPGRGPRFSYRSPGRRAAGDAGSPHGQGTSSPDARLRLRGKVPAVPAISRMGGPGRNPPAGPRPPSGPVQPGRPVRNAAVIPPAHFAQFPLRFF